MHRSTRITATTMPMIIPKFEFMGMLLELALFPVDVAVAGSAPAVEELVLAGWVSVESDSNLHTWVNGLFEASQSDLHPSIQDEDLVPRVCV